MAFAFGNRAYPANDSVWRQLVDDRARFAALAGYPSYAAYDFGNRMAGTPGRVQAFLDDIDRVVRPLGQPDAAPLLPRLRRDDPSLGALNSWLQSYACRLVRK